jgi:hypothetical protein
LKIFCASFFVSDIPQICQSKRSSVQGNDAMIVARESVGSKVQPGFRSSTDKPVSAGRNAGAAKASDTEITKQFATLALRCYQFAAAGTAPLADNCLEALMLRLRCGSVSPALPH